jgi:hypothetical protein
MILRHTFYIGLFLTLLMLNAWWFTAMAYKLDAKYSSHIALFIDASVLALGITLMYIGVFGW